MEPSANNTSPAVPIAIVFGFAMIAIAIFFTGGKEAPVPEQVTAQQNNPAESSSGRTIRTVDETDYIKGNPNAPILIVEYSDYECPFCKQYHDTLNQIMDEFGVNGKVAWVYRQFPLAQLHPNAPKIAQAALCVGELGGTTAFWKFTDKIFAERDINAPTNMTRLPAYATFAGVSQVDYINCVSSDRHQDEVIASAKEAAAIGAQGTPYTVMIAGDQEIVVSGAQSYSTIRGVIKTLVDQLNGIMDVGDNPILEELIKEQDEAEEARAAAEAEGAGTQ